MHAPKWKYTYITTGRVRFGIGRLGKAVPQIEVICTKGRFPGEKIDCGTQWVKTEKYDSAYLVRLGVLEGSYTRGDQ